MLHFQKYCCKEQLVLHFCGTSICFGCGGLWTPFHPKKLFHYEEATAAINKASNVDEAK